MVHISKKNMNILQITDDLPPRVLGGSGRIVLETSEALADRGHDVSILTAGDPAIIPSYGKKISIHTIPVLPKRWAHYRSVFSKKREEKILAVIRQVQPDIIHAHGIAWQMGYRWIGRARKMGIPCIWTAHGTMHISYGKVTGTETALWLTDIRQARWTYNPFRNACIRSYLHQCHILSVSDALRDYMANYSYTATTLHNGINLNFWQASVSQKEARQLCKLPADKSLFLIAGRMGYSKGLRHLLRSLPAAAHLIVAGSIDSALVAEYGERLHPFSNQTAEQMKLLYAACDATVVPSVYLDPFPTVCLESMACSRPVIATSWGGSKEAVIDSKTGWIVDPTDNAAFSSQLNWCSEHRTELPSFGKAGREHMEKHFARELYIDQLLEHYGQCRN
ncbi:MAG: hypothetical protein JWM56_772 [Candidatus Peribacteria bacterium]|nr:hypothetical protein [Candidatus Peribacteria bacterium]